MNVEVGVRDRRKAMAFFDLLFYLACRNGRGVVNGYGVVGILVVLIASGLLFTLSALIGVDVPNYLRHAYPVDIVDIPQSPLRKEAGPAVLFCFPASILFLLIFYRRSQVRVLVAWYESRSVEESFLLGFFLFLGSMAAFIAVGVLSPKALSFPFQILLLFLLNFLVLKYSKLFMREVH